MIVPRLSWLGCLFLVAPVHVVVVVQGYIPSTHNSQRQVPQKTVKLEPVLQKNPLQQPTSPLFSPQEEDEEKETLTTYASSSESEDDEEATVVIAQTEPESKPEPEPAAIQVVETLTLPTRQEKKLPLFVASSAALAGFTDILCLAQFGCFVNMMTGNLLKMVSAAVNFQRQEMVIHAGFVLSYVMGVSIFNQIKKKKAQQSLQIMAPLVAILFASADMLAHTATATNIGLPAKALQVPCLAMGFGAVNSAAGYATGGTIFFALTGHLTKMTNAFNDALAQGISATSSSYKLDAATKRSISVVSSFLGGAFAAAVLGQRILPFMLAQKLWVPPLCTSLGLLYASLFAWYAPLRLRSVPDRLFDKKEAIKASVKITFNRLPLPRRSRPRASERDDEEDTPEPTLMPAPLLMDMVDDVLFHPPTSTGAATEGSTS